MRPAPRRGSRCALAERRFRGPEGLSIVSGATLVAGLGAYVITTLIARGLGDDYHLFAVFWSMLYLVAGALAGVQQEVTRATGPRSAEGGVERPANVIVFALSASVVAGLLVAATSPLWASAVFTGDAVALVVPLSVGATIYLLLTAATGTMYGARAWRRLAAFTVLDVAFRLVLVLIGLALGIGVVGLAWAAVVPFLLVILVVVVPARSELFSTTRLDVGYGAASLNVLRTVIAAGSAAVLVSGFPLLTGLTTPNGSGQLLSAVVFALTLTRAPIVIATLSLQSYLLVQFTSRPDRIVRMLVLIGAGIAAVGAVLGLIAWWIGADAIVLLAGEGFRLPAAYVGLLVATSVLTGLIMITGTAVLARGLHTLYSVGWLVAALVSVIIMLLPGDLFVRSLLALAVGPLAGLVVHVVALGVRGRGLELTDAQVE